ncbi:MAG: GerMN domain-containing protein [Oscillospiraceae bacterium]
MKKLLALTLALLTLSACGPAAEKNASEGDYGLWFAVERGSGRSDYSAVAREGRQWEREPTLRELVQALLDGPESDGLYAPFPSGVTIQSIAVEQETQTVRVDLSEQYGGLAGFDLTLADYCIALTLCQLPGVETVKVTVEGKSIPYRDRQELRTGDVLLSGIAEEPDTFLAALYFPSRTGGTLTAEYRQVSRTDGSSPVEIVMAELLRGPTDRAGSLSLPEGTQVRSLSVRDGICQVDLSEEFLRSAPPEEEQAGLTLYALVNSLCALSGVNQVRLLIEGESIDSYGSVSAGVPLSANYDLANQ